MRVATIMVVYGGDSPRMFERAILSIINQRLHARVTSRIYLGVNGPVSAEIEQIVKEHAEGIYKIVRLEKNIGLAGALNSLIEMLEDETLIFRMDSDDYSLPARYQLQITYFNDNPHVDVLGTDIIEVMQAQGIRRVVSFYRPPEDVRKRLCRGVPVAHPSVCLRRHVFQKVGGYPIAGTNEDIALWFKCAKAGFKFDNLKEPLLEFSIDQNFWQRRSLKKSMGEFQCYMRGIYELFGITWRFIYPVGRFALRISPQPVIQAAYRWRSQANS